VGPPQRLRLLSYNIQAGIRSNGYPAYLIHSWKHLVPHGERLLNLRRIAALLGNYDLVALQEVDGGSLRTSFVDQTAYLASAAGFPFWGHQVNRNLGAFARHSNGVLSRIPTRAIERHRLPGIPGRGAMVVRFDQRLDGLVLCVLHLALGRRARMQQLDFVGELLAGEPRLVVMGDLNCGCGAEEIQRLTRRLDLISPDALANTFPSWRPKRRLDHILLSSGIRFENPKVLDYPLSDHLPVAVDLLLDPATTATRTCGDGPRITE
jgi:endonuclease/exonuclease/phosphatase family metal-dependent hydrolase